MNDTRHDIAADIPPRAPGRLEARRCAFLVAARAVFMEKGYGNTTLDDVIARSGGSRQTLYALFGGKQGLFTALVVERSVAVFASVWSEDLLDRPPDEVLPAIGASYLRMVTSPEAIGLFRLVISEAGTIPELAERFWSSGPTLVRTVLARYFTRQAERGALAIVDPERAAQQFWGMLLGTGHMECVLGLRSAPEMAEIEAAVRAAVSRFLDGCRPA